MKAENGRYEADRRRLRCFNMYDRVDKHLPGGLQHRFVLTDPNCIMVIDIGKSALIKRVHV